MYDNLRHMYYYLKDITEQRQFLYCKLVEWCNSYTKDLHFQKKFEKNLADWRKKKNKPDLQMDHSLRCLLFSELPGSCSLHCIWCNWNYALQKVCLAISCAGLEYQKYSFYVTPQMGIYHPLIPKIWQGPARHIQECNCCYLLNSMISSPAFWRYTGMVNLKVN